MRRLRVYINIAIFLLLVPAVYGSYAVSSPKAIVLEKGDSKEFDFQIQAYTSEQDLICGYELGNTTPFEIIFEKESFEVNKGRAVIVNGIVKAPENIDKGDYSYDFCIGCSAKTKSSGAATNVRYCGIPINVKILEPEKEIVPRKLVIIIGLPIVVLIIFLVIIIFTKKRRIKKLQKGRRYRGKGKNRKIGRYINNQYQNNRKDRVIFKKI